MVFLISVFLFRRNLTVREASTDLERTTITDYAVMVTNLPPNATKADVVAFFSDRFNPNNDTDRWSKVYDEPGNRIICEAIHDLDGGLGNGDSDGDGGDSTWATPVRKRRSSMLQQANLGIWVEPTAEEEAEAKARNPEFYRKWKASQDEMRKRAQAAATQRRLKKREEKVARPLYPVVNSKHTGGAAAPPPKKEKAKTMLTELEDVEDAERGVGGERKGEEGASAQQEEDAEIKRAKKLQARAKADAALYKGTYIAECVMAYHDGNTMRMYVAKQKLLQKIHQTKAMIQMHMSPHTFPEYYVGGLREDEPEPPMIERLRKKLKKLTHRLETVSTGVGEADIGFHERPLGVDPRQGENPDERPSVAAFVVFNHETSWMRAVQAYRFTSEGGCCTWLFRRFVQPRRLRFPVPSTVVAEDGKTEVRTGGATVPISVRRAPDPSDLLWENLDTSPNERSVRVAITTFLTLVVLSISFGLSVLIYSLIDTVSQQLAASAARGDICGTIRADALWHAQQDRFGSNATNSTQDYLSVPMSARTPLELATDLYFTRPDKVENAPAGSVPTCPSQWLGMGIAFSDDRSRTLLTYADDGGLAGALEVCADAGICPASGSAAGYCQCVPADGAPEDTASENTCAPAACVVDGVIRLQDAVTTLVDSSSNSSNTSSSSSTAPGSCSSDDYAYSPSDVRNCYCVETMRRWNKAVGSTLGAGAFVLNDGDLCYDVALLHYGARQLTLLGPVLVVVLNIVLQKVVSGLAKWERHPTITEFLSAQMMKTWLVLFINTGFVVLIVNSKFVKQDDGSAPSVAGANEFRGGYSSFSALWYSQVGVSLTLTMVLDMVSPHMPVLLSSYVVRPVLRACATRPKCRERCAYGRKIGATQEGVDRLHSGVTFVLPLRLATVLNTTSISLVYCAGLPGLVPLAAISFLVSFQLDKTNLLRNYKRPPEYTTRLVRNYFEIVPIVLLLHCGVSLWMYTDPTAIASPKAEEYFSEAVHGPYAFTVGAVLGQLRAVVSAAGGNGDRTPFLNDMESRLGLASAVGPVGMFLLVFIVFILKNLLVTCGNSVTSLTQVCPRPAWLTRCIASIKASAPEGLDHLASRACGMVCGCCGRANNEESAFEHNPPFTEHYLKVIMSEHTGKPVRSLELAQKKHITQEERLNGWVVRFEQQRRLCYKIKLWGKSGSSFGRVYDGDDPMMTYEYLHDDGLSHTYSIQSADRYAPVLEAQQDALEAGRAFREKVAAEKAAKKAAKQAKADEKMRVKQLKQDARAMSKRLIKMEKQANRRSLSRGQSKRGRLFGRGSARNLTDELEMWAAESGIAGLKELRKALGALGVSSKADLAILDKEMIGDVTASLTAIDRIKFKNAMQALSEGGDDEDEDEDEEMDPITAMNILSWSSDTTDAAAGARAHRLWKLRNKVRSSAHRGQMGAVVNAAKSVARENKDKWLAARRAEREERRRSRSHSGDNFDMDNAVELEDLDGFAMAGTKQRKKTRRKRSSKYAHDGEGGGDDWDYVVDISDSDEEGYMHRSDAPRWTRLFDSTHQSFYWQENGGAGVTQWDRPSDWETPRSVAEMRGVMRFLDEDVKAALLVQQAFRRMRAKKHANAARLHAVNSGTHKDESGFSVGDWHVMQDEQGNDYYVHALDGRCVWELPDVDSWESGGQYDFEEAEKERQRAEAEAARLRRQQEKHEEELARQKRELQAQAAEAGRRALLSAGVRELSLDDVKRARRPSAYAVAPRPPGVHPPTPGQYQARATPAAARRKSVKRPDGTWIELPG